MFRKFFKPKSFQYKCNECGEIHSGAPSFSFAHPVYVFDVPEEEQASRVRITEDLCRIEPAPNDADQDVIYCIRCILEIPIKGSDAPFTWGIWVTQSKESFDKYIDTFDSDQTALQSFGWLAVNMPYYKATKEGEPLVHLECDVHFGPQGQRPKIYLWENTHALAVHQHRGLTWRKAVEIATFVNH